MTKIVDTRKNLNIKVEAEIMDKFKQACVKVGIPMNTLIEKFMKQFGDEEFQIKIAENFQMKLRLRPDTDFERI